MADWVQRLSDVEMQLDAGRRAVESKAEELFEQIIAEIEACLTSFNERHPIGPDLETLDIEDRFKNTAYVKRQKGALVATVSRRAPDAHSLTLELIPAMKVLRRRRDGQQESDISIKAERLDNAPATPVWQFHFVVDRKLFTIPELAQALLAKTLFRREVLDSAQSQ